MPDPSAAAAPSAPSSTRFYDLPHGIRIAADVFGDAAARPVVFLHGGGQTRHAWAGAAAAVARAGYQAITLDHRGHGESSWAESGGYRVEDFATDLAAVVARLGRAPVVVGASLGGITAMHLNARDGAALAGIVLVDVTPRMEISGVQRIVAFMGASPDGFASLEEVADAVASYLPHRPRPKDLGGLQKNLRVGPDGRYRWHWDPALMKFWNTRHVDAQAVERAMEERIAQARAIRVPTLLVRGRMSDVVTEEGAREFLSIVPHAEYVDLEAAGHMVAGDRNDAFTSSVLGFLSSRFPVGDTR